MERERKAKCFLQTVRRWRRKGKIEPKQRRKEGLHKTGKKQKNKSREGKKERQEGETETI